MKRNVGVWIDHRKAVIVHITDNAEQIHTTLSGMEKHVRHAGGEPEDQQEHGLPTISTNIMPRSYHFFAMPILFLSLVRVKRKASSERV